MPNNIEVSEPILEAMRRGAEATEQFLALRHVDELAVYGQAKLGSWNEVPEMQCASCVKIGPSNRAVCDPVTLVC